MDNSDDIRAEERADRFPIHCPDCDDLCEPWTDDGVSCDYKRKPYISQPLSRVIGDKVQP